MGIISPYLVRLRIVSLQTTGTSVAFLSAANAIGGIIGTFSVGFIFFGYIGSRETLMFIAVLLLLCSLYFAPYKRTLKRIGLGIIITFLVLSFIPHSDAQGEVADIDTPSATDLVFFYTQQMAALVEEKPQKHRILVLGGGAFTLPSYLGQRHPLSQIDVVEIDSELVSIAKQFFNYRAHPNVRIYAQDARQYLNANKFKYDIVIVDVYADTSIPFSLTTTEYAAKLKASLKPGGMILANIIGSDVGPCGQLLRAVHASYSKEFSNYRLYPQLDPKLETRQNIIFVYSNELLKDTNVGKRDLSGGLLLTDNYAPIERLKLKCQDKEF
jgi:protein-L-isoaspartate O-methyltransferase